MNALGLFSLGSAVLILSLGILVFIKRGHSVVQGIIKEHGGRIDISSQPGQGTTIRLSFPVMRSDV